MVTFRSRSCLRSTKPNADPSRDPNVSTHIRIAALLWDIEYSTLNTQHSILDTQYSTLITQYLTVNTQYSNTQYSLFLRVINNTKGEFAVIPITTRTHLAYFAICHCTEYLFFVLLIHLDRRACWHGVQYTVHLQEAANLFFGLHRILANHETLFPCPQSNTNCARFRNMESAQIHAQTIHLQWPFDAINVFAQLCIQSVLFEFTCSVC